jgi:hypothetical protein
MPTMSASDYTNYVKLKAAQLSYSNAVQVPRALHTTAQPVPSQSILNAQLLASQASYVVNPKNSALQGLNYVKPRIVTQYRPTPKDKATVSWTSGTSGSVGSYSSSATNTGFGLPAKNKVGTYYRDAHTALPNNLATGRYAATIGASTTINTEPNNITRP